MRKVVLGIVVLLSVCTNILVCAKEEEPALSTSLQSAEAVINTKPDKSQQDDWKQKQKENKLYFKTKKNIEKQENKRNRLEQETQYLQKRLEAKKKKLDELAPTSVKGEKEE